jgi:hypothetical protein
MLRVVAVFVTCSLSCGRAHFDRREDAIAPPGDVLVGEVGCADGAREGFVDQQRFPTIAGCAATWLGQRNLRAPRTGVPCGDDSAACGMPVDACAIGWHVCADQGDPIDLTARVTVTECDDAGAAAGSFVGASGHCSGCANSCTAVEIDCTYAMPLPCMNTFGACAEPVCCGVACSRDNTCRGGFFPSPGTKMALTTSSCGSLAAMNQTGVLCCAD